MFYYINNNEKVFYKKIEDKFYETDDKGYIKITIKKNTEIKNELEKVFAVIYLHDGTKVYGIFSTLEKAEEYIFNIATEFITDNNKEFKKLEKIMKKINKEIQESYQIRVVYGINNTESIPLTK